MKLWMILYGNSASVWYKKIHTCTFYWYCEWRKYESMFLCPGGWVNTSYEWIASCAGSHFPTGAPEAQGNSTIPYCAKCPNHLAMSHTSKTRLAQAIWHHTPGTTASWFWARTILQILLFLHTIYSIDIYIATLVFYIVLPLYSIDLHVSHMIHWGWDKMTVIFQTTFCSAFSWMKMYIQISPNLFPRVQLTIFQFRWWLGAAHYCGLFYWHIYVSPGLNESLWIYSSINQSS